ncbi:uncharacterized protein LOC119725797 [Patiria miniata]|uniref:EGF-like domain-containing protein n=1 Tax=Patiria miniata TaxID=46514 RepID=A0A913ZNI9_PATMI|nr:uncharacterized protein LOC119725797 [Patiria miniata]
MCSRSGDFPDFVYSCECASDFTGSVCDDNVPSGDGGVIAIVVTVFVLVICCVVFMLCVCCCYLARRTDWMYADTPRGVRNQTQRWEYNRGPYFSFPSVVPRRAFVGRMRQAEDTVDNDARIFYENYDSNDNMRNSHTPYIIPGPALMWKMDHDFKHPDFYY